MPSSVSLGKYQEFSQECHTAIIFEIFSLAQDMEIRSTLADIEAVVSVIGLIISDYPVIQQLALNLCSILCLEQSSCDQLVANDGLNKLLLFVENQG